MSPRRGIEGRDEDPGADEVLIERIADALVGLRRITKRTAASRPKPPESPYFNVPPDHWADITRSLIEAYPISPIEVVDIVRRSWDAIFESVLGDGFRIGIHIFPSPQIMGTLLHELIPLEIERLTGGQWRAQRTAGEKDLVFLPDDRYSTEIKTSSDPSRIYANRSYGQESQTTGKKAKSGYYIAVNFDKWPLVETRPVHTQVRPRILAIRVGWIDHTDWVAQRAATGQQSSLPAQVENAQLLAFYKR